MSRLDDALRRAVDTLDGLDASFALVGGMAVSVLAAPRITGDVDLAVAVGSDADAESIARGFAAAGYRIASLLQQDHIGRLAGVRGRLDPARHPHSTLKREEPVICSWQRGSSSPQPVALLPGVGMAGS